MRVRATAVSDKFAPLIAKTETQPAAPAPARSPGRAAAPRPPGLPIGLGNRAMSRIIARVHAEQRAVLPRRLVAPELAHLVLRQPAPKIEMPRETPVEPYVREQTHGFEGDDLARKILELADRNIRDSALYKAAIRASGPLEKGYVYRNPYTVARLAEILDLGSFDQCVALLEPDQRGRVLAAMARIKKKYGLGEVTEEGAPWSESELAITDRSFAKMTTPDQEMLHGLRLVRKKDLGSDERQGKKFSIAGRTIGGDTIELTQRAFRDPFSILHEVGHLIQQKQPLVGMEALQASATFTNLAPAAQKYSDAAKEAKKSTDWDPAFNKALNELSRAVTALIDSPQAEVQSRKESLNAAEVQAEVDRANERSKPWLEAHDRLKEYANAVEQWVTRKEEIERAPADIEKAFVDIVKKNRLNRRDFAPFTDYVAHSWPDKPQEFLVQCYATWRANPDYLRSNAPKLFEWFQRGGHLGSRQPAP